MPFHSAAVRSIPRLSFIFAGFRRSAAWRVGKNLRNKCMLPAAFILAKYFSAVSRNSTKWPWPGGKGLYCFVIDSCLPPGVRFMQWM